MQEQRLQTECSPKGIADMDIYLPSANSSLKAIDSPNNLDAEKCYKLEVRKQNPKQNVIIRYSNLISANAR